ncbi:MAG TPA: mechanosensitive ion channel domain-containing protein [Bryobacteraceae bacterium]|nr:mechanosensitive ion channel domain-containing protein [Bryobacteraceae bacterium]
MRLVKKYLLAGILTLLLAAAIVGSYFFRDTSPSRVATKQPAASPIDDRLLKTAQQEAAVADTADEQALAHEALRLADHELDQDFSGALRDTASSTPVLTGPLKELADRVAQLKAQVAREKTRVAKLTKDAGSNETAASDVEVAKAQLALDEDELNDAREDLARQGGDKHAAIERLLQEHEAAHHGTAQALKTSLAGHPGTLWEQLQSWLSLRDREKQLEAARSQTVAKAAALEREHNALEAIAAKKSDAAAAADAGDGEEDTAAMLDRLHRLSDRSKTLAELDRRIQDTKQLGDVYQRWSALVQTRQRGSLHLLLISVAMVLGVLLAVVIVDRAIRHAFDRQKDRRQRHHLRVLATIGVQLIGVAIILVITFGPPTQASTLIGLTTAGLTVALKDFIVAFFGWFVLMGKNGMRVGDWVEIEGVGGEVIEIGMFKTVLLEVGTRTSTGHPTGRRVAFMNKFAIENHYFNFSTSGQWLWDELQMTLPLTGDPYKMALAIRERVEKETETDGRAAESDWERVTHQYGTSAFSAKPEVDLRPSINGLEVIVRYITRAPQRYVVKSRLFEAIVGLIHKPTG